MIRNILSVFVGYLIFAVSSVLLFTLTGQKPHAEASIIFKIITIAYGAVFSIIAGFVLQLIAKQKTLTLNYILGAVIFLVATISLGTAHGTHWTQLFAMFIFAPVSVLGGYFKFRVSNNKG
jgi:ABC-type Fe3+-siderophore transport system permease subunit